MDGRVVINLGEFGGTGQRDGVARCTLLVDQGKVHLDTCAEVK